MDGERRKLSHKGVPKTVNLTAEDYRKALYENDLGKVKYHNITISKKNNEATLRCTTKLAFNSVYTKMHVEANQISIRPHMINNEYV